MTTVQAKLPGLDPGRAQTTLPAPTEAQEQQAIEEGLTRLGYVVLHTQHVFRFQHCPHCNRKFRPVGGYGTSPAIPDLLVSRDGWPPVWIGLEVKGAKTKVSPEQQELEQRGRIVICRSWEAARAEAEAVNRWLTGGP